MYCATACRATRRRTACQFALTPLLRLDHEAVHNVRDARCGPGRVHGLAHRGVRPDRAVEVDRVTLARYRDSRVVDDRAPLERLVDAVGDVARNGLTRNRHEVVDTD